MGRVRQGSGASAPRIVDFERGRRGRRGLFSTTALVTRRSVLALALAAVLWPQGAGANPEGGTVVGGAATIVETSPTRLDILQTTDRAIIDWRSFSIGEAEHTNFSQPSMDSVTLNRVIGGDLSTIAGRLSANGNIVLINPNGVIFTSTARIDVHSLIASTSDLSDDDFMEGRLDFSAAVDPNSFVINRGEITVAEGGLVALVAPWVENSGVIAARLGRVELASGGAFTIDLYGDQLIQLALAEPGDGSGEVPDELSSAARVSNLGLISADGGVVALTVADAQGLVDNVINMEGIIEARTVEQTAGRIILDGGATGIVSVTGTLDASGKDAGEVGGEVAVLGEKVGLFDGALIDVSGDAGGGTALIGGNYQGSGPELNAQFTYLSSGMKIDADAITQGDGGTVIVWADQGTRFEGTITARGGAEGGDGGFVEVSGKESLTFLGSVDLTAANGATGTLLLDPNNLTIDASDGSSSITGTFTTRDDGAVLDVITLEFALLSANVVIETGTAGSNTEDGDITILTTITSSAGNDLTLLAHDDIIFGASGSIDFSASSGDVFLTASGGAIISFNSSPAVIMAFSFDPSLTLTAASGIGDPSNSDPFVIDAGNIIVSNTSGAIDIDNVTFSLNGFDLTLNQTGGGAVSVSDTSGFFAVNTFTAPGSDVTLDAGTGSLIISANLVALGSLNAEGGGIVVFDVTTIGSQTYTGSGQGVIFASTYVTGGGDFTVNGNLILFSDTSISTSGGNITFNGTVDGNEVDFFENLTLVSGSGAITFNNLVGSQVALGVVDATGSSSLVFANIQLISDFLRVDENTPLPAGFNVLQLLPEFVQPTDTNTNTDTNILIQPIDPFFSINSPLGLVDATPTTNLLTLAGLSEIAPGAGTEGGDSVFISELDSELAADAIAFVVDSCPDVVLTSLSWQNSPADAAFKRNPMLLPYSVDEFCAGYTLTIPGRGSAEAYQGLTFVRRDFWTDLKQSRDEEVIAEIRGDFGLPEREGN